MQFADIFGNQGIVSGFARAQYEDQQKKDDEERQKRETLANTYLKLSQDENTFTPEQRNHLLQAYTGILNTPRHKKLGKEHEGALATALSIPRNVNGQQMTGVRTPQEQMASAQQAESFKHSVTVPPGGLNLGGNQLQPGATVDERLLGPMATSGYHNNSDAASLAKSGFKRDPQGNIVPMTEEDLPLPVRSKMAREAGQMELDKASKEYKLAATQYALTRSQSDSARLGMAAQRLLIAKQNADRKDREFEVSTYGTDNGTVVPGALAQANENGTYTPIGSRFSKGVMPTVASQGKAEAGANVLSHGAQMLNFISAPENADLFGKVQGRWTEFAAGKLGTDDPRVAAILPDLQSLASLLAPLHGFRSRNAAEEFIGTMNLADSPEALAETVKRYMDMAQIIYEQGDPLTFNASGGVQRRTPLADKPQVVAKPPAGGSSGPPTAGKALDKATAAQFLKQAGGDKAKARELAKAAGYTF